MEEAGNALDPALCEGLIVSQTTRSDEIGGRSYVVVVSHPAGGQIEHESARARFDLPPEIFFD